MDLLSGIRLALGAAAFAAAAIQDVRTRRVGDPLWIGLGSAGLALLLAELVGDGSALPLFGLVAAAAILFYAIFFGKPLFEEDGFHARPRRLGLFALAAVLFGGSVAWVASAGGVDPQRFELTLSVPVMILVYEGFYQVGVLHGGADTKGLIALTLLLPAYPNAAPFPLLIFDPRLRDTLQLVFPFSLTVLVNAAILSLVIPLGYLVLNAARGDLAFPQALFGRRIVLDGAPRHAWLMERITDSGEHVLVLFPRRGRDQAQEAERLRAHGIRRAWVQPQVPFMVPLFLGLLLAIFVGNLLLAFLAGVLV